MRSVCDGGIERRYGVKTVRSRITGTASDLRRADRI
jgi:hypothetical protein